MTSLGLFALVLALATLTGLFNARILRLPFTIGVLLLSLVVSAGLSVADWVLPLHTVHALQTLLTQIDLPTTLMEGALAFLLFAGAQGVDLGALFARKFSVLALALLGTLLAVVVFAAGAWGIFTLVGLNVPLAWCVVLGAILAPTDPVSVVGMLRRLGLPAQVQALFAGESLFNDGVGVVIFTVALEVAHHAHPVSALRLAEAFTTEVGGGLLVGLVGGWLARKAFALSQDPQLDLLISLTLCTGTYSLCTAWGLSGPIATVTAGLCMAAPATQRRITEQGRKNLHVFWELVDEVLNAMLFALIGFQVLALSFSRALVVAAALAIPLAIIARLLSVLLATLPVYLRGQDRMGVLAVLTWGGLRGGISISLALGLPESPMRAPLLAVCYCVVVFTILVQGLTIAPVVRKFHPS
ncbi:MAG: cation:proton antiporter [Acetobacter orientalis]|uniref:cation:proton antiporter n=1 Tax=Acetobacter orientalis TaxID=146474 RepID=UPI0039E87634